MTRVPTDAARDGVDVHNRLDKVVLAVEHRDGDGATTALTPGEARRVARALSEAADAAERTPPG